jgi:hypothetical protein
MARLERKEARMKTGAYVIAILAFGAVSTNAGHARHAHHSHGAPTVTHSQDPQRNSKSQTGTGGPQSPGSGTQAGVTSHVNDTAKDGPGGTGTDKSATDQSGPRSKTLSKTGVSTGAETGNTTETAAGHRDAIKSAPRDGAKEINSGAPIDTRITVHQGRAPNKDTQGIAAAIKDSKSACSTNPNPLFRRVPE